MVIGGIWGIREGLIEMMVVPLNEMEITKSHVVFGAFEMFKWRC